MKFPSRLMLPFLAIALASATAFGADPAQAPQADDGTSLPARADSAVRIMQMMVDEISNYAKDGDKEMQTLLQNHKLDGPVDWEKLRGNLKQADKAIESLVLDIAKLAKTNPHAKSMVDEFHIELTDPTKPH